MVYKISERPIFAVHEQSSSIFAFCTVFANPKTEGYYCPIFTQDDCFRLGGLVLIACYC